MIQEYICCDHQALAIMDHKFPLFSDQGEQKKMINTMCMRCYTHWAGYEGEVKQYTRAEWNAYVEKSFSEVAE